MLHIPISLTRSRLVNRFVTTATNGTVFNRSRSGDERLPHHRPRRWSDPRSFTSAIHQCVELPYATRQITKSRLQPMTKAQGKMAEKDAAHRAKYHLPTHAGAIENRS